jgi:hypothetical protein
MRDPPHVARFTLFTLRSCRYRSFPFSLCPFTSPPLRYGSFRNRMWRVRTGPRGEVRRERYYKRIIYYRTLTIYISLLHHILSHIIQALTISSYYIIIILHYYSTGINSLYITIIIPLIYILIQGFTYIILTSYIHKYNYYTGTNSLYYSYVHRY